MAIGGLVKVKRQRWWGHLTHRFQQQPSRYYEKEWCQRTNRAVFTSKKTCREAGKVTYQDHLSTLNNSVSDAIRRGAAENEVQKHEETEAYRCLETNQHTQATI